MSAPAPESDPDRREGSRRALVARSAAALAIAAVVAWLYAPTLGFPFLEIDDLYFVAQNPVIRDLSWERAAYLFVGDDRDFRWFPLTYLSLAVDHALFGPEPRGFHATNVALHVANTLLVFAFVGTLSRDGRVAAVTSLLFGIHPLQLESVAWVNSRKNVLFLFFFLLAALAYLRHAQRREHEGHGSVPALLASHGLFALAVLAKTAAVTLPAVLVLVDHRVARVPPRSIGRFLARSVPPKLAYLPVVLLAWWMTERRAGRSPFLHEYAFDALDWIVITGHNLFFYVAKAVAPMGLGVFYPLPDDGAPLPLRFPLYALAGVMLLAVGIASHRRQRDLAFGLGWYFATILPMAILPFFFSDMPMLAADRYFYQSAIGLFYLVGVGAVALWDGRLGFGRIARPVVAAALALVVGACVARTVQQRWAWRDTRALYEETVRHHPSDAFLYRLAILHADQGRMAAALRALEEAEAAPHRIFFTRLFGYQFRIADLYRRKGEFEKAARFMEDALASAPNAMEPLDPRSPWAYRYLAELYEAAGRPERAEQARARAREAPSRPGVYFERLWLHAAPQDARRRLEERLAEAPYDAETWLQLARWHERLGDGARAREARRRAAELGLGAGGDVR
jgi:tetratricopeptide (TPR) repeat protein